jgi:hypothetical protein
MRRLAAALLLALSAALLPLPATAQVLLSFHSFNGSMFGGRYPHTFIVLEGTLDSTGEPVRENYGYTARKISPAILAGPVRHQVMVEKTKYLTSTNRHFTVPISDETYRRVVAEVARWRDEPGNGYDLDRNNCIHFVGRIAQLAGLAVDYPKALLRKPRAWLNRVASLNPALGARPIG